MSDFLRDLSPHRAHEASRAVPVLPSPFETMHPLRYVGVDTTTFNPAERPLAHVRPSPPPQHTPGPAPALRRPDVARPETATVDQRPVSPVLPNEEQQQRPSPNVASPIEMRSGPHMRPLIAADDATKPPLASPAIIPSSIAAETSRHYGGHTQAVTSTTSSSFASSAPMSSHALAARAASRAGHAPIINVTIDRIEVRAPTTPERVKLSTRSRSSISNLSLNDYLRGREPERRGGRS